jgi:hypothetical protein
MMTSFVHGGKTRNDEGDQIRRTEWRRRDTQGLVTRRVARGDAARSKGATRAAAPTAAAGGLDRGARSETGGTEAASLQQAGDSATGAGRSCSQHGAQVRGPADAGKETAIVAVAIEIASSRVRKDAIYSTVSVGRRRAVIPDCTHGMYQEIDAAKASEVRTRRAAVPETRHGSTEIRPLTESDRAARPPS